MGEMSLKLFDLRSEGAYKTHTHFLGKARNWTPPKDWTPTTAGGLEVNPGNILVNPPGSVQPPSK
eukprot:8633948-Pyramimonas_sp.AAC.1